MPAATRPAPCNAKLTFLSDLFNPLRLLRSFLFLLVWLWLFLCFGFRFRFGFRCEACDYRFSSAANCIYPISIDLCFIQAKLTSALDMFVSEIRSVVVDVSIKVALALSVESCD